MRAAASSLCSQLIVKSPQGVCFKIRLKHCKIKHQIMLRKVIWEYQYCKGLVDFDVYCIGYEVWSCTHINSRWIILFIIILRLKAHTN